MTTEYQLHSTAMLTLEDLSRILRVAFVPSTHPDSYKKATANFGPIEIKVSEKPLSDIEYRQFDNTRPWSTSLIFDSPECWKRTALLLMLELCEFIDNDAHTRVDVDEGLPPLFIFNNGNLYLSDECERYFSTILSPGEDYNYCELKR